MPATPSSPSWSCAPSPSSTRTTWWPWRRSRTPASATTTTCRPWWPTWWTPPPSAGARGVGGMATKVQAARLATSGGTDAVIAGGHEKDVLLRLAAGEHIGTLFPASVDRMESRKRWMLSGLAARGRIVVDEGAARALRKDGKSLLPAGVREVEGPFERGDAVNIYDPAGERIACGITNYSDAEVAAIRGLRSDRIVEVLGHQYGAEVVHRSNLVLL